MHDPIGEILDSRLDPAQQAVLGALEQQSAALGRVRLRTRDVLDIVPTGPGAGIGWRGLAALAFDTAIHRLRGDIAAALSSIESADTDTRLAIATLSGRM